ncbi:hypothetical protein BB558_001176 [Smittium angustum]|uniref:Protein kinase domain-containing protein n=1 Tax=Smittium angustum TaxID=133377 RepID=A0A2U1JCF1_SMIAN|nr:hypothetical protein BB558_001176 [Smittium angustum]
MQLQQNKKLQKNSIHNIYPATSSAIYNPNQSSTSFNNPPLYNSPKTSSLGLLDSNPPTIPPSHKNNSNFIFTNSSINNQNPFDSNSFQPNSSHNLNSHLFNSSSDFQKFNTNNSLLPLPQNLGHSGVDFLYPQDQQPTSSNSLNIKNISTTNSADSSLPWFKNDNIIHPPSKNQNSNPKNILSHNGFPQKHYSEISLNSLVSRYDPETINPHYSHNLYDPNNMLQNSIPDLSSQQNPEIKDQFFPPSLKDQQRNFSNDPNSLDINNLYNKSKQNSKTHDTTQIFNQLHLEPIKKQGHSDITSLLNEPQTFLQNGLNSNKLHPLNNQLPNHSKNDFSSQFAFDSNHNPINTSNKNTQHAGHGGLNDIYSLNNNSTHLNNDEITKNSLINILNNPSQSEFKHSSEPVFNFYNNPTLETSNNNTAEELKNHNLFSKISSQEYIPPYSNNQNQNLLDVLLNQQNNSLIQNQQNITDSNNLLLNNQSQKTHVLTNPYNNNLEYQNTSNQNYPHKTLNYKNGYDPHPENLDSIPTNNSFDYNIHSDRPLPFNQDNSYYYKPGLDFLNKNNLSENRTLDQTVSASKRLPNYNNLGNPCSQQPDAIHNMNTETNTSAPIFNNLENQNNTRYSDFKNNSIELAASRFGLMNNPSFSQDYLVQPNPTLEFHRSSNAKPHTKSNGIYNRHMINVDHEHKSQSDMDINSYQSKITTNNQFKSLKPDSTDFQKMGKSDIKNNPNWNYRNELVSNLNTSAGKEITNNSKIDSDSGLLYLNPMHRVEIGSEQKLCHNVQSDDLFANTKGELNTRLIDTSMNMSNASHNFQNENSYENLLSPDIVNSPSTIINISSGQTQVRSPDRLDNTNESLYPWNTAYLDQDLDIGHSGSNYYNPHFQNQALLHNQNVSSGSWPHNPIEPQNYNNQSYPSQFENSFIQKNQTTNVSSGNQTRLISPNLNEFGNGTNGYSDYEPFINLNGPIEISSTNVMRSNARLNSLRKQEAEKKLSRAREKELKNISNFNPLHQLTINLVNTYRKINPGFEFNSELRPRRALTKPSEGILNNGYDNENSDYILYVNDIIGEPEGNQYLIIDALGSGTFGQVVKSQNIKTGELVAIKVVKNKTAYFQQSMMEVHILTELKNTWDPDNKHHFLRLKEHFIFRNHLCFVNELLSINLYELLKQNSYKGLSTTLIRVLTSQILDSLNVLDKANIIHCDLKPENILLEDIDKPTIKVIDFGSSCYVGQTFFTYIQSRFYRSPEVLMGLPYGAPIDMWSLGCIVAELYLGLPIFPGSSEFNQVSRIVELLGMPNLKMLEKATKTTEFFRRTGANSWRIKTTEEFNRETGKQDVVGRSYFVAKNLNELITQYPYKKDISIEEMNIESTNRIILLDFLHKLLDLNPDTRLTPGQALVHPFITGDYNNILLPNTGYSSYDPGQPPYQGPPPGSGNNRNVFPSNNYNGFLGYSNNVGSGNNSLNYNTDQNTNFYNAKALGALEPIYNNPNTLDKQSLNQLYPNPQPQIFVPFEKYENKYGNIGDKKPSISSHPSTHSLNHFSKGFKSNSYPSLSYKMFPDLGKNTFFSDEAIRLEGKDNSDSFSFKEPNIITNREKTDSQISSSSFLSDFVRYVGKDPIETESFGMFPQLDQSSYYSGVIHPSNIEDEKSSVYSLQKNSYSSSIGKVEDSNTTEKKIGLDTDANNISNSSSLINLKHHQKTKTFSVIHSDQDASEFDLSENGTHTTDQIFGASENSTPHLSFKEMNTSQYCSSNELIDFSKTPNQPKLCESIPKFSDDLAASFNDKDSDKYSSSEEEYFVMRVKPKPVLGNVTETMPVEKNRIYYNQKGLDRFIPIAKNLEDDISINSKTLLKKQLFSKYSHDALDQTSNTADNMNIRNSEFSDPETADFGNIDALRKSVDTIPSEVKTFKKNKKRTKFKCAEKGSYYNNNQKNFNIGYESESLSEHSDVYVTAPFIVPKKSKSLEVETHGYLGLSNKKRIISRSNVQVTNLVRFIALADGEIDSSIDESFMKKYRERNPTRKNKDLKISTLFDKNETNLDTKAFEVESRSSIFFERSSSENSFICLKQSSIITTQPGTPQEFLIDKLTQLDSLMEDTENNTKNINLVLPNNHETKNSMFEVSDNSTELENHKEASSKLSNRISRLDEIRDIKKRIYSDGVKYLSTMDSSIIINKSTNYKDQENRYSHSLRLNNTSEDRFSFGSSKRYSDLEKNLPEHSIATSESPITLGPIFGKLQNNSNIHSEEKASCISSNGSQISASLSKNHTSVLTPINFFGNTSTNYVGSPSNPNSKFKNTQLDFETGNTDSNIDPNHLSSSFSRIDINSAPEGRIMIQLSSL